MKTDQLKKHHYWILFGVAMLFIPLAFLLMWLIVSGRVKEMQAAYQKQMTDLNTAPKTKGEVDAMEAKRKYLEEKKIDSWIANYERQKKGKVFDWPTGGNSQLIAHSEREYKFGDPFRIVGLELNQPVLEKAFNEGYGKLAENMAPTRFSGGTWQSAVRHVTNWGKSINEPKYVWLAIEDYWVQKSLLEPIARVNADAAVFRDVTPKDADSPLKRKFRNRIWELDLEVYTQGNKPMMKGQLRNLTDRLQVLGLEKAMRVSVWLDNPSAQQRDFEFVIQGENVPGRGRHICEPREIKNVARVDRLAKVIQVFDEASVPVRLVQTVELGKTDHKNRTAVLEPPDHLKDDVDATTASALPGEGQPANPASGLGGVGMGADGGVGGIGGVPGGTTVSRPKTGSVKQVLQGNKLRYLKRTDEVRRMPVALSVVMDSDFVNDLLIAFSNSSLRFQVTQTQWQRYRGVLPAPGTAAPPSSEPGSSELGGDTGGATGSPDGEGEGEGGKRGGGGGYSPGRQGSGGSLVPPSGFPGSTPASGGSYLPDEANAGLVEVAVFGVVSLYEKKVKEAPKPGEQPDAAAVTPPDPNKPMDPMGTQPDPTKPTGTQPDPAKPMGTTPEKAPTPPAPPMPPKDPMGTTPAKDGPPMPPKDAAPAKDAPPMPPKDAAPTSPPK